MKPPDFKCYGCGGTPCNNPGFCGMTMQKAYTHTHTISYQVLDLSGPQFLSFGSIVFQAHKDYLTATLKFMDL